MTEKSSNSKLWLTLALSALITLLITTHIPQRKMPVDLTWFNTDKLMHVLAYGVVFALFVKAYEAWNLRRLFVLAIVILLIGVLDEWTQEFVGRQGSIQDWAANLVGVILVFGWVMFWQMKGFSQKRSKMG